MDDEEIWKPIAGYEGLYEVSSMGRIANLNYDNKKGCRKVLSLTSKSGYIKVTLRDADGKNRTYWVHRLVGYAFLPPPLPEQTQINHISGEKQDNRVSNIEWVSPKQNCRNPNTRQNYYRRYHKEGEFERRSAAQKKRFREHPEQLRKIWEARRKKMINR